MSSKIKSWLGIQYPEHWKIVALQLACIVGAIVVASLYRLPTGIVNEWVEKEGVRGDVINAIAAMAVAMFLFACAAGFSTFSKGDRRPSNPFKLGSWRKDERTSFGFGFLAFVCVLSGVFIAVLGVAHPSWEPVLRQSTEVLYRVMTGAGGFCVLLAVDLPFGKPKA